jgi:hypothetical protein
MRPGTIAWSSIAPGFQPPGPHPLLVVRSFPNVNLAVAFVTHSEDLLRIGLQLRRQELPSAFRDRGGPLTDEAGVLALVDHRGNIRLAVAEPVGADRLQIGSAEVALTRIVQLPDGEWQPLRIRIRSALGVP